MYQKRLQAEKEKFLENLKEVFPPRPGSATQLPPAEKSRIVDRARRIEAQVEGRET